MGDKHEDGASTSGRPVRTTPSTPGSAVLTPPTGLPAVGRAGIPAPRSSSDPSTPAPPAPTAPPAPPGVRMCTCGHSAETHEHYRPGDDCGACGPRVCGGFRAQDEPEGPVGRAVRRLRRG